MKKVKFLRLASLMLMLCLITTCAISGTFAKYTTSGSVTDTARVAKWGVTVATVTDGNMFAKTYAKNDDSFTLDTNTVVHASNDLVAPGTTGTLTSISVTGTPEVAVKVTYSATLELGENWMVDGNFYCPIVFKVGDTEIKQDDINNTATKLEDAVKAAIDAYTKSYAAGTDLSAATDVAPSISWTWAFSGDDAKDTALGNLATAPTIKLTVNVTVTQID